jgi:hypothetical protein
MKKRRREDAGQKERSESERTEKIKKKDAERVEEKVKKKKESRKWAKSEEQKEEKKIGKTWGQFRKNQPKVKWARPLTKFGPKPKFMLSTLLRTPSRPKPTQSPIYLDTR